MYIKKDLLLWQKFRHTNAIQKKMLKMLSIVKQANKFPLAILTILFF